MESAATIETLDELREKLQSTAKERDSYRKAYEAALLELERLRRNLFGRKSEHVDPAQVALAFEPFRKLLAEAEAAAAAANGQPPSDGTNPPDKTKAKSKPRGRRNLAEADLPEEVIEIVPPDLPEGATRLEAEVSYRLEYKRGGWVRLKIVRPHFVVPADEDRAAKTGCPTTIVGNDMPHEMIPRGMPGPGALAHVIASKFRMQLPFNRQEESLSDEGLALDRGTMCRWTASCHALASTVVNAMEAEARATAAVIATDATGILVQHPEQCRRGHFWVFLADRDHVFFRYTPRHTQKAPLAFFAGYEGIVQADASSVYDALFRKEDGPEEAGCWSHGRRKFFDSIKSHRKLALVGIGYINRLFELEREWKNLPPGRRAEMRRARAGPVLEGLRAWKDACLADRELEPRAPITRALRYIDRHWDALTRFLTEGRLRIDNNPAELALRSLVVGRKNWLFVGHDEGAEWACTFVSLIASCRLHDLDPEGYLRDLFRLLPSWPKSRVLELAPKYWARTRARLDASEVAQPLGHLTVPPPLPPKQTADQADAA